MASDALLNGRKFVKVSQQEAEDMELDIFINGMVRILPEGWLYPSTSIAHLNRLQTMKFRSDDVIVNTFPKCGTTWMQEILWTMLHNPKLDNPAAEKDLWLRSPEISLDMMFDLKTMNGPSEAYKREFERVCSGKMNDDCVLQLCEASPSPRVLKCHIPLCLLPDNILDKAKVVYVARNPKDMAVSYYFFYKKLPVYPLSHDVHGLIRSIMSNKAVYGPFWEHVKAAWEKRHHPNLHFVFYEDMKADILSELRKLNEFLGTHLSQDTLQAVAQFTSFTSMKSKGDPLKDELLGENVKDTTLFRKGQTGDWKNHFTPELQKEMDRWSEENIAGTDLSLSWALTQ